MTDHARVSLLVALVFATAFVARAEGLWLSAWGRVKRTASRFVKVRRRLEEIPDALGVVIRNGIPYMLYADGTMLRPVAGGAIAPVKEMTLDEVVEEAKEITPVLQKAFSEAGQTLDMSKVTAFGDGLEDGQKSERLATMNVRLHELSERKMILEAAEKAKAEADEMADWLDKPASGAPVPDGKGGKKAYEPLADLAMKAYDTWGKGYRGGAGPVAELDISAKEWLDREVKTVMSTGAGFAPQAVRTGLVTLAGFWRPTVIDLIPVVPTSQNAYVFMRQTTRTNNAAEVAESVDGTLASLAESAFVYTEVSEPIRKIGHFIPVTDEQLEDIEGIDALLRNDMIEGVRQRLSSQLMNGNGTAPNIEGFLDAGRDPTDVDTTGDFVADAVDKLIENVRVLGFTEPTAVIMNPTDWHGYRRATTVDGIYIAGHPSENIANTMWGLPVVLTTEVAAGSAHCGNYAEFTKLAVKRGVEVSISSEHASYFIQGLKAIKAEIRAGLVIIRETAFAKTNDIVVS